MATTKKLYWVSICFHLLLLFCSRTIAGFGSTIKFLPGFNGPLPFELETGYVGVDDDDVQLFYYFIKSESNPRKDPLLLWITGGPGCSSLSGVVYEIGPLHFKVVEYDGTLPTLVQNLNSWTKVSNIIFLDTPVGTGFSYSNSLESSKSQDTKSAKQTYEFLRKWLIDHPEFLSNPLYVGGDSYSGITVPLIVQDISDGIQDGDKPIINLKGYLLGNPSTDTKFDQNSLISYVHGMALLSDELYESTRNNCGEEYVNVDPSNALCLKDLQAVSEVILKGISLLNFGMCQDMSDTKNFGHFSILKSMVLYLFTIYPKGGQKQACKDGHQKLQQLEHSQLLWDLVALVAFLCHILLLVTKQILAQRRGQEEVMAILLVLLASGLRRKDCFHLVKNFHLPRAFQALEAFLQLPKNQDLTKKP